MEEEEVGVLVAHLLSSLSRWRCTWSGAWSLSSARRCLPAVNLGDRHETAVPPQAHRQP